MDFIDGGMYLNFTVQEDGFNIMNLKLFIYSELNWRGFASYFTLYTDLPSDLLWEVMPRNPGYSHE